MQTSTILDDDPLVISSTTYGILKNAPKIIAASFEFIAKPTENILIVIGTMGKRSLRSPSPPSSKSTTKKAKSSSPSSLFEQNPFWEIYGKTSHHASIGIDDVVTSDEENRGDSNQVDQVFDDVLQFMEISKKRKHDVSSADVTETKAVGDQDKIDQIGVENTVERLLVQMRVFQQTSDRLNERGDRRATKGLNVFVSAEDIARLLLPWSVKGILHNPYGKKSSSYSPSSSTKIPVSKSVELLFWKTLHGCLCFFLGCSDKEEDGRWTNAPKGRARNNSLNILTLSTMHKLVPIALRISLQECDLSEEVSNKTVVTLQEISKSCFCRLVDHLYRPPFDLVCDTLLPIIAKCCEKSNNPRTTAIWVSVTISTLRLLTLRLANANPKKGFQLLVRSNVFLNLATIHQYASNSRDLKDEGQEDHLQSLHNLFNDLIRSGIFSLEHHVDGFRSLQLAIPTFDEISSKQKGDKKAPSTTLDSESSFRGYQERLFDVLEDFLIAPNDNDGTDTFWSKHAATVSSILPLLLDIFVDQTSKMQKQKVMSKSHKKSKATDKLGHLQFRFFSRLSGLLLKGLMTSSGIVVRTQLYDTSLRLSLFSMLGKNLNLLLRHNIYQPSLGNNMERIFLVKIAKETIQFITAQSEQTERRISFTEWKKSLIILNVLIQLNHTILHDQLTAILSKCLTHDASHEADLKASGIREEASTFLITIISTYGRLRQLDYFYRCLFDAVKVLSRQNDSQRIMKLLAFANDSGISSILGKVIQGSPIQQLKQIFYDVNDSIVSRSYSEGDKVSIEVTSTACAAVAKFLVGLLRSVRVDSTSFNDILPICEDIMSGSVVSLIESDEQHAEKNTTGNTIDAIILCAWTLHLKNQCEFWTGEKQMASPSKGTGMPPIIHLFLKDAITRTAKNALEQKKIDPELLQSLKFLACQRIQELHGECYDKQRLAYGTDAKQYSTASETLEARQLVNFMLQRFDSNEIQKTAVSQVMGQLASLADSIATWAPYADKSNIDSFLNQILQVTAIEDDSCGQDRKMLLGLLNDTSFYEISGISQRLGMNIASFVAENVHTILRRCDSSASQHMDIVLPTIRTGWKALSVEGITKIHRSEAPLTCHPKDLSEIIMCLRGSLRVLDMINNAAVPILWNEFKDVSTIFQSLMGMESICNILHISSERFFLDTKVRLVSALRITASRVLASVPFDSNGLIFVAPEENYVMLLPLVLESSFEILHRDSSTGTIHPCVDSCTMIVKSIVNNCIGLGTKSTIHMIKFLDSTFDQAEIARGGFQYLILTKYAIILIRKFGRFFGADGDNKATKDLFRVIKNRLWKTSHKFCFSTPEDAHSLCQNQSIIFIAEALRFSSICSESQFIPSSSVENEVVARLRNLLNGDPKELEARSISYLVGCLAMVKPSRPVRQELTSILLLGVLKHYDLFVTPLCILARGMETKEFDNFLTKLTSEIVKVPDTAIKLKIMHMIVTSTDDQSHIDVVSNHSAMIMNNCLQVMTQVARQIDVNSDSILTVSSLIVDMASKKNMMVLHEREIALILARITSTIRVSKEHGERGITDIQLKAYDATFSLVSFFLQRFSKQVQNCVPSLVISLTTMLQFVLSKSLPSDHMSHCGQKFSRLCELLLPHGDVYKKHVICLILRFVNSLRNDVHTLCKKGLLPGIYCLLDLIQEYETMQLNSMLDEECRALLRSVHDDYKKIHVYKGQ